MPLRKQFLPCPKNYTNSEHCSLLELYFLGNTVYKIIFLIFSVQEEQFLYLQFSFMMCYFGGKWWNSQTDEVRWTDRYLVSAVLYYLKWFSKGPSILYSEDMKSKLYFSKCLKQQQILQSLQKKNCISRNLQFNTFIVIFLSCSFTCQGKYSALKYVLTYYFAGKQGA